MSYHCDYCGNPILDTEDLVCSAVHTSDASDDGTPVCTAGDRVLTIRIETRTPQHFHEVCLLRLAREEINLELAGQPAHLRKEPA